MRYFFLFLALSLGAFFLFSLPSFPRAPQKYLYSQKGQLPLLISVPHDGGNTLPIPPRRNPQKYKDFLSTRDLYTANLAKEIHLYLRRMTRKSPYLLIQLVHRKYCDPNRPPQRAYEHPLAKNVYKRYHQTLQRYIKEIRQKFGYGLLIDLHGQKSLPADIYLGTQGGKTLRSAIRRHGRKIWLGKQSLSHLLHTRKYTTPLSKSYWIPHPRKPSQKVLLPSLLSQKKFNGGFIVQNYGSHRPNGIDAIQLEVHQRLRFSKKKRRQLAKDLAKLLLKFLDFLRANSSKF
ncbi:MAG: hypothetical protein D6805_06755 [Planctomycetota bacterium]|nr:MAG: hypothetical protein D6805_06755 [Planctomycetota bacterium]